jgi:hypothetical protein
MAAGKAAGTVSLLLGLPSRRARTAQTTIYDSNAIDCTIIISNNFFEKRVCNRLNITNCFVVLLLHFLN